MEPPKCKETFKEKAAKAMWKEEHLSLQTCSLSRLYYQEVQSGDVNGFFQTLVGIILPSSIAWEALLHHKSILQKDTKPLQLGELELVLQGLPSTQESYT